MNGISTIGVSNQPEITGTGKSAGAVTVSPEFERILQNGLKETSMDSIFEEAANRYNISEKLLRAVAKAESDFNPYAVSKAGAMGVMQLMPDTAKGLGVTDPFDARQNIMAGAKYLKSNLDKFQNTELALAAYNAGPGSVQKYGGIPPYKETQNYVKKVLSYMGDTTLLAGKTESGKASGERVYAGSSYDGFGSGWMLANGSIQQSGDKIIMDKESFVNLVQMFRVQMLMDAGRKIGSVEIGEA